jgi:hypothetical protein
VNVFMTLLYVAANLVIAVMVGCMLQSKFVESEFSFRLVVALLGAAAIGCAFYGLGVLPLIWHGIFDEPMAFYPPPPIAFPQVLQSLLLAAVLLMMRIRQVRAGEHEHPRQRAARRLDQLEQFAKLKG